MSIERPRTGSIDLQPGENVMRLNHRGEWVPAIPLPLFTGFRLHVAKCECGARFHNQRRYREHYALVHILGLD